MYKVTICSSMFVESHNVGIANFGQIPQISLIVLFEKTIQFKNKTILFFFYDH